MDGEIDIRTFYYFRASLSLTLLSTLELGYSGHNVIFVHDLYFLLVYEVWNLQ